MYSSDKSLAVLGIGNALVDIISILNNDHLLNEFGLARGSMTLVDSVLSRKIYTSTKNNKQKLTTGGSAANTIHALSSLNIQCGYLGKIGKDELGSLFQNEFEEKKIRTHLLYSDKDTGRAMSLVSNDSERTMATYLGAAADLHPYELQEDTFKHYSILYLEGYLVQDHQLITTAVDIAHKAGLKIAIDLSSYNIVEMNYSFLRNLISEKIDIVFANEQEAYSFTGKSPEGALTEIASMCETAIVKTGKSGSLIQRGSEKVKIDAIQATAVDTTGAGDNYAAGFLFGYINHFSLNKCGKIAALISGKTVEVIGAKIPKNYWPILIEKINKITD